MPPQDVMLPLKKAYQEFAEIVRSLSDEQFLTLIYEWAPRDMVAHLVGWNTLMIESSQAIMDGRLPAYYEDEPNNYSTINGAYTAKFTSKSKLELLDQLQATMEELDAFILGLPENKVWADYGVRHYSGETATVGKIVNSLAGDYAFHTQQIREWLGEEK